MNKVRIIFLTLIMMVLSCACGADDIKDQAANIIQAEDEHVLGVKGGTPNAYPGKTFGEAFENFFGSPTWKYFVGTREGSDEDGDGKPDYIEENIDIVEFTGYCTYQGVEVKARIQFTLSKEDDTFSATYLSFNEVPQSMLMLSALMEKVFTDEDVAEAGLEESFTGTAVLYYDMPEGFVEQEDGMWYAPDYPYDTANVSVVTQENDSVTFQYTKESFCEDVEYVYDIQYGYTIDVNCTEFTRSELNGCRTLLIRASYNLEGIEIEQILFAVETAKDTTTTITYTQQSGGAWMDAFNASIASMRIGYEDFAEETGTGQENLFTGKWEDVVSERCYMVITYEEPYYYIDINWSSSAVENTRWALQGQYDENMGGILYWGECLDEYYSEYGTEERYHYWDGQGFLFIDENGLLYWEDYEEQVGDHCIFRRAVY